MVLDPIRALPSAPLPVAIGVATGGAAILVVSVELAGLEGTTAALQLAVALQTLAVVALLGAGTLCLSRSRVDGRAPACLLATACVVYALGAVPLSSAVSAFVPSRAAVALDEAVRLAVTAIACALAVSALRQRHRPTPQTRQVAMRTLALLGVGLMGVVVVERAMAALPGIVDPEVARVAFDAAAILLWLGLAAISWRHRDVSAWARRAVPFTLGLATVRALDALAADAPGSAAHLGAMLLASCLAVLAVVCALRALVEAIDESRRRAEATERELDRVADGVLARDAWREELSHDATNAISGLRAALSTLARYDERLDTATARRLREAALAEVAHLEHLIARSAEDQPVVFDVAEVIGSVVAARRVGGLVVEVDDEAIGPESASGGGLVEGRPGDLATVLHNLLINVAAHAPGSPAHVSVRRGRDRVGLCVRDEGPGIARADRARVFRRGVRGPNSVSTGLGLYLARELMREQGGELVLTPSPSGCCFVATLPAAATPESQIVAGVVALPQIERPTGPLRQSVPSGQISGQISGLTSEPSADHALSGRAASLPG